MFCYPTVSLPLMTKPSSDWLFSWYTWIYICNVSNKAIKLILAQVVIYSNKTGQRHAWTIYLQKHYRIEQYGSSNKPNEPLLVYICCDCLKILHCPYNFLHVPYISPIFFSQFPYIYPYLFARGHLKPWYNIMIQVRSACECVDWRPAWKTLLPLYCHVFLKECKSWKHRVINTITKCVSVWWSPWDWHIVSTQFWFCGPLGSNTGDLCLLQFKSVGPKLVPFFKTVTIFFVLFGEDSKLDSLIYCVFKCLPIFSLMIFVLLHGMNFSEAYAYSRKILIGLVFSALGDACLVWKNNGYFLPGVGMFGMAQIMYALAFGFSPLKPGTGVVICTVASLIYLAILPGLKGIMVYVGALYCLVIFMMLWRAVSRVQIFNDLWTWTKLCSCAGAICFVISDFLISFDRFVMPVPYSHQLIMVTYYAAQVGISLSVVDSQVDHLLKKTQ